MNTPFSDHSATMLNIQSFDQRKKSGPGFWKFNASLLEDKEFSVFSSHVIKTKNWNRSMNEVKNLGFGR